MSDLPRHTFMNPAFVPHGCDADAHFKQRVSGMAYDLHALIAVCSKALTSEHVPVPSDLAGIGPVLDLANHLAGDLICECERLETGEQGKNPDL